MKRFKEEKTLMYYESTRSKDIKATPAEAILQGLSDDGGLFVAREIGDTKLKIEELANDDYFTLAGKVLGIFLQNEDGGFSEKEITQCVKDAYSGKFATDEITPLVKLQDAYVLELFNGPTSAFKDVALQILPHFTKVALSKTNIKEDILILTATSGDTGKAALEGFKDVDRTNICVFYPNDGVSKVQEMQMATQEGKNVAVCSINGNFDDAQSGVKEIFTDNEIKEDLKKQGILLSSANSINVGRLVPQVVYYFYAYIKLVQNGSISIGDKVNYVVPTGNFGDILAGYYAKLIGLPVGKLVCASNENNVLYNFLTTGTYDKNREFLKTISPSMDILISSNLERLLYYIADKDNGYVAELMEDLTRNGKYELKQELFAKIQSQFKAGYADDEETQQTIAKIFEKDGYLLDPHTAVAYKVLMDELSVGELADETNVVLATASPYKFSKAVMESFGDVKADVDEFEQMKQLQEKTNISIPTKLADLQNKTVLHDSVIDKEEMKAYVLAKAKEFKK